MLLNLKLLPKRCQSKLVLQKINLSISAFRIIFPDWNIHHGLLFLPLTQMQESTRNTEMNENQWPWVLSKVGKKVLRPGGRELTMWLIDHLQITSEDSVLEFAPGIGFTAIQVLKKKPKSYTGIELNEEAGKNLREIIQGENKKILIGNAADAHIVNATQDKVFGEAMLTMHADQKKSEIIHEAYRLLKEGGLYGIHELCLVPDNISPEKKKAIQKDLSSHSHVNTRPLTQSEWISIIEKEGFHVIHAWTRPMMLLEPSRIIRDEGVINTLTTAYKVMRRPKARKKIFEMRKLFQEHRDEIRAIGIIAEKK